MNIGIFDSGNGGRMVAKKLQQFLPQHTYTVIDDAAHAPYGERDYAEIETLTQAAVQPLVATCPVIVLACNTATAAAIESLRARYPTKQFIGYEPMIKPAALLTKTRKIILLATRATARAPRTRQLIDRYAADIDIVCADTTGWAAAVDAGRADTIDLGDVAAAVSDGFDTIIVGCTHYIALQPRLESLNATVLEPTRAIAHRIRELTEPEQQL